tara:strand:+ start:198 stop:698 length:501 start_codon:yes stop_codon:yes gene_type:complete
MSQLKVNSIVPVGGVASGQAGGVIQTIQTFKGDTTTTTSTSFSDITGMNATITPTSSSNKVLVRFGIHLSSVHNPVIIVNLLRGSTNIAQPTVTDIYPSTTQMWVDGDRMLNMNYEFLDSPSTTSSTTYKLQWRIHSGSYTVKLNGYYNNDQYNSTSTMTLQEVSA